MPDRHHETSSLKVTHIAPGVSIVQMYDGMKLLILCYIPWLKLHGMFLRRGIARGAAVGRTGV